MILLRKIAKKYHKNLILNTIYRLFLRYKDKKQHQS